MRASGIDMIAAERARQKMPVEAGGEGYDLDHDLGHADELAVAATCYAMPADARFMRSPGYPLDWPWGIAYWKPTPNNRIRELVKAGAMIAAAIDALQQAAQLAEQEGNAQLTVLARTRLGYLMQLPLLPPTPAQS